MFVVLVNELVVEPVELTVSDEEPVLVAVSVVVALSIPGIVLQVCDGDSETFCKSRCIAAVFRSEPCCTRLGVGAGLSSGWTLPESLSLMFVPIAAMMPDDMIANSKNIEMSSRTVCMIVKHCSSYS